MISQDSASTRARSAARRVAGRIASQFHVAGGGHSPEADAMRAEVIRLSEALASTRIELQVEIELLWAELESRPATG